MHYPPAVSCEAFPPANVTWKVSENHDSGNNLCTILNEDRVNTIKRIRFRDNILYFYWHLSAIFLHVKIITRQRRCCALGDHWPDLIILFLQFSHRFSRIRYVMQRSERNARLQLSLCNARVIACLKSRPGEPNKLFEKTPIFNYLDFQILGIHGKRAPHSGLVVLVRPTIHSSCIHQTKH